MDILDRSKAFTFVFGVISGGAENLATASFGILMYCKSNKGIRTRDKTNDNDE